MPQYTLAVVSDRSTFSMALDVGDDEAALARAVSLVTKARVPIGAKVTIVRGDATEIDVSEVLAPHLDRPGF